MRVGDLWIAIVRRAVKGDRLFSATEVLQQNPEIEMSQRIMAILRDRRPIMGFRFFELGRVMIKTAKVDVSFRQRRIETQRSVISPARMERVLRCDGLSYK